MAHAGTTTNLKQPAATGSGRQAGLWLALITGAVIVAIASAFVMTQLAASKAVTGSVTAKTGYDAIEAQRGPSMLSIAGDRSFDQIEAQRGTIAPALTFLDRGADRGAVSFDSADHWYDAMHPATVVATGDSYGALRAAAFAASLNQDRSQDQFKHAPGRGPLP
jgi:hypothetical protein